MIYLKDIFPLSFNTRCLSNLIFSVLLQAGCLTVINIIMSFTERLYVIGIIIRAFGTATCFYLIIGIVIAFLSYFKILKD